MPATGKTVYTNLPYNTLTTCGFFELYAYQEWARFLYSKLVGSNTTISKYQRRIVLMPNNNCQFYGSGSQGCLGSYCSTWIRGDRLVKQFSAVLCVGPQQQELKAKVTDFYPSTPLQGKLSEYFLPRAGTHSESAALEQLCLGLRRLLLRHGLLQ